MMFEVNHGGYYHIKVEHTVRSGSYEICKSEDHVESWILRICKSGNPFTMTGEEKVFMEEIIFCVMEQTNFEASDYSTQQKFHLTDPPVYP